MPQQQLSQDPARLPPSDTGADLQTVLAAWHAATVRLEHTHEALRAEVGRLTSELEIKNRELARTNRLADLGRMASHVAHEVRNNLVPVSLYLSLLRRRLADDLQGLDVLDKLGAGFQALDVTVHDLLHFTSDRDPQRRPFRVEELIEEVRDSLRPQLEAQAIETVLQASGPAWATADRDMVRRAVLNLVLNALDAMPEGGTLSITATAGDEGVEFSVGDTGTGLSEDARQRVFEPFFTTKQGGTGLGLAIVYRIAEVHGGTVTAGNRPQGGALFTFRIPTPPSENSA